MKNNNLVKISSLLMVVLIGLFAWLLIRNNNHPRTIEELMQKYESKQTNWTEQDTQNCLEDYYRIEPEAKNRQNESGNIALSAPCPGIPQ